MPKLKTLTLAALLSFFGLLITATYTDADEAKPPAKPTLNYYFFEG